MTILTLAERIKTRRVRIARIKAATAILERLRASLGVEPSNHLDNDEFEAIVRACKQMQHRVNNLHGVRS